MRSPLPDTGHRAVREFPDRRRPFSALVLTTLVQASLCSVWPASPARADASPACPRQGEWITPSDGRVLVRGTVMEALARKNVVLLGEIHSSSDDHRWQLQVMAGLYAHRAQVVLGFEMFPRHVQDALDAWRDGRLTERAFLEASHWNEVWGYREADYLPLFHFARMNRLPMVALNVRRDIVARIAREGFDGVPAEDRMGVGTPAPVSAGYREYLATVFLEKAKRRAAEVDPEAENAVVSGSSPDVSDDADFRRFVEAQSFWDRAMAEAIRDARATHPDALVIAVIGRGHLEHRYGVPHQLAALGVEDVSVVLPLPENETCKAMEKTLADAVFVTPAEPDEIATPAKPRLGVMLRQDPGIVVVTKVMNDSVAFQTGLREGDILVSAAATPIVTNADLIRIVKRQAPGTWLPLTVKRGDETFDLVAKFPPEGE